MIKMMLRRCVVIALVTLHLACLTSANKERMVKAGVITKAAFPDALKLCPERWNKKRKAEIVQSIRNLMKPAFVASDPNRNSYGADYVPTEEEVRAKSYELCQLNVPIPSVSAGDQSSETESLEEFPEPGYLEDTQLSLKRNEYGFFEAGSYGLFFFGTAVGMLMVFIYFHARGNLSAQSPVPKSLRRPEL